MNNKLTIKGVQYPCRITMGAMVRYKRESGHDISQMTEDDLSDVALFMYCATASACAADGVEFPYDFMTFADLLDPLTVRQYFSGSEAVSEKKTTEKP